MVAETAARPRPWRVLSYLLNEIRPFRDGVFAALGATDVATVVRLLDVPLARDEACRYLRPVRDLPALAETLQAIAAVGYVPVLAGNDVPVLVRRVADPLGWWQMVQDGRVRRTLILFLVVQTAGRRTAGGDRRVHDALAALAAGRRVLAKTTHPCPLVLNDTIELALESPHPFRLFTLVRPSRLSSAFHRTDALFFGRTPPERNPVITVWMHSIDERNLFFQVNHNTICVWTLKPLDSPVRASPSVTHLAELPRGGNLGLVYRPSGRSEYVRKPDGITISISGSKLGVHTISFSA